MKNFEKYQELETYLKDFRIDMHAYPELSRNEYATTEKIKTALKEHGIRILDLPLDTCVVAEIGENDGDIVVLRADIDALPITEEADVEVISKNVGVMHACGHDFHTATVLGAAILLKQNEANLKGKARIVFQPAEEIDGGAESIIETGIFEDASAVFGFHNDPTLPVGTMGSKHGALTAGVDRFVVKVQAKGAHAARPHDGNDPIIVLTHLVTALQSIISRNVESSENAVLSVTQLHSGTTWNVIPDGGFLEGTVRTFGTETRELIEKRFREIVAGVALTYGVEIEIEWHKGPPSVMNDPKLTDFAMAMGQEEDFIVNTVKASPIGEDFAMYQLKVPGTFMMIGSGGPYALHHPKFKVDDRALFPASHYLYRLIENSFDQLT